jgi:hypothetical protein
MMMDAERNMKGYNLARKECLLRTIHKDEDICTLKPNPFDRPTFFGLCQEDLYNSCPLFTFIRWMKNFDK